MKLSRKGFTLVELLAVIVVLAIIALVAVPTILGVVEKARKGAAESSALAWINAVENQVAINLVDTDDTNNIPDGVITVSELINTYGVSVKGQRPTRGDITIEKGKVTYGKILMSEYNIEYDITKSTKIATLGKIDLNDKISPVCGEITGENTTWTANDIEVGVKCVDNESGCEQSEYKKKLTTSGQTEEVSFDIMDLAGNVTTCTNTYNKYIDKETLSMTVDEANVTEEYVKITIPYTLTSGPSGATVTCEYKNSNDSEYISTNATVDTTANTCVITGLSMETSYDYKLTATSQTGVGGVQTVTGTKATTTKVCTNRSSGSWSASYTMSGTDCVISSCYFDGEWCSNGTGGCTGGHCQFRCNRHGCLDRYNGTLPASY